ncbi:MAG: prephenate dehydrogenase [Clostridiales bacterium]|jgi:prephenate dehydrogenase|nr:prephenate dehydrogenase [Clostridiales bacterium]
MRELTVTIVGLGLIGGSVARSLKPRVKTLYAVDQDASVLNFAAEQGVIDAATENPIPLSDVVILCVYPSAAEAFLRDNAENFKDGAVVTDVVGVKAPLARLYNRLKPRFAYIGGHPMAGRETSGFLNASDDLFSGASFIITAPNDAEERHIALVEEIAAAIGCGRVLRATVEEHDQIIAYTSQLPHVIAAAMCDTPMFVKHKHFTGGSFEDVTRVAKINETLWTELFLANGEYLVGEIDRFTHSVGMLRDAVARRDGEALRQFLRRARQDKEMIEHA